MTPSIFGSINFLERLTELRKHFTYGSPVYYKIYIYNADIGTWRPCIRKGMGERHGSSLNPVLWIFMEALLHNHD